MGLVQVPVLAKTSFSLASFANLQLVASQPVAPPASAPNFAPNFFPNFCRFVGVGVGFGRRVGPIHLSIGRTRIIPDFKKHMVMKIFGPNKN